MNHEVTTDDLQEPAEMSLMDAIIEGAEQPRPRTDQDANPLPMKEAAAVPVDVSTPEEVATEDNPTIEEPMMPVKLPKVTRPVAPYKYAAARWCLRPLPSPVQGLSLRQTGPAGKTSIWHCKLILKTLHPAGCHDQRTVQGAQTSAGAACLAGAAIGTSAKGICNQRAGTAGQGGSPQGAVAIILPQGGQG